jgi:hypothetical protein
MKKAYPSAQVYPFTIPDAGGSVQLPVSGSYFKIRSASGNVAVQVDSGAKLDPLAVGQGLRGVDFTLLTITDKSGAANSGTIIVASTEFIDDQVFGVVSVSNIPTVNVAQLPNASLSEIASVAGQGFSVYASRGVNNTLGVFFLINPAGSGRQLFITDCELTSSISHNVYFKRLPNAACNSAGAGMSSSSGLVASGCRFFVDTQILSGFGGGGITPPYLFGNVFLLAAQPRKFSFPVPLFIAPGECFVAEFWAETANVYCGLNGYTKP